MIWNIAISPEHHIVIDTTFSMVRIEISRKNTDL